MQEEVTQKTIALSVKTARVTADVLKNMLRKYLSGQKQKGKNSYKVGKQSYKELKGRSEKGSGLGLSIVHQLVEKMGGSITVESLPGKGTEFMLLFPLEI